MEPQVYMLEFENGEKAYFIAQSKCKNGMSRGLAFDQGAAGRSSKKPKTTTVDLSRDWKRTDIVPPHVFFYLKESQET